jgi:hypothetical protein
MSIALAIRSRTAVVIATDSQRVSANGISEAPFNKTFRLPGKVLGAFVGLVEISSISIATRLRDAVADTPLDILSASAIAETLLVPILTGVPESEVAFQNRRLDLILASRDGLRCISFFPGGGLRQVRAEVRDFTLYATAGEEAAKVIVLTRLGQSHRIDVLGESHLRSLAVSVCEKAIAGCGPHPHYPSLPSCCGPINLLSLPGGV